MDENNKTSLEYEQFYLENKLIDTLHNQSIVQNEYKIMFCDDVETKYGDVIIEELLNFK